jgi:hypothetical protein
MKHAVTIMQFIKKDTAVFLLYIITTAKKQQSYSGYIALIQIHFLVLCFLM